MAERELRGLSPTYERLCLGLAADDRLIELLDTLPRPTRQPNLLLAAARLLGAPLADYGEFAEWVLANWPELSGQMLARRTQTNEPNRCAALLPALALLPGPFALIEVGASAGLCLYPDWYSYRYDDGRDSAVVGTGLPQFPCRAIGLPAAPDLPAVVWRAGLDIHPLSVADREDMRWLRMLVWPEQTSRAARLAAAIETVRPDPPRIVRGDLSRDPGAALDPLIDEAAEHGTVVVFHTAVIAYLGGADRAAFTAHLRHRIAPGGVHWIANEGAGVFDFSTNLARDRAGFVVALDERPLAHAGAHGQWLEWLS